MSQSLGYYSLGFRKEKHNLFDGNPETKCAKIEAAGNRGDEITQIAVRHPLELLAVSHIFMVTARARAAVVIPSVFLLSPASFTLRSPPSLSGEPSPYMDQAL